MRLGCINHALLTVEAIQARGLKVAGWVANTVSSMQLLEDNIQSLKDLMPAPLLGVIPKLNTEEITTPYPFKTLEKVANYLQLPK
jgi:dethiobiotin synthetase